MITHAKLKLVCKEVELAPTSPVCHMVSAKASSSPPPAMGELLRVSLTILIANAETLLAFPPLCWFSDQENSRGSLNDNPKIAAGK
jgi:hypothetical protein